MLYFIPDFQLLKSCFIFMLMALCNNYNAGTVVALLLYIVRYAYAYNFLLVIKFEKKYFVIFSTFQMVNLHLNEKHEENGECPFIRVRPLFQG